VFKKVAFTMYPISDVARARKFYEETLGLKRGSMGNQGDIIHSPVCRMAVCLDSEGNSILVHQLKPKANR
jgi:predicted enzyme related to lactoylglutathione lyase